MMGMKKGFLFCLLFMLLFVCGCAKKEAPAAPAGEGWYSIYYLNASGTKLVEQPYETKEEEISLLIGELMEAFTHAPRDQDCQSALSDKVSFLGNSLEDEVLYLYFDVNYTSMPSSQEILCRGALARTLTQIEGVTYISVYCGDQPLLDKAGSPVGVMGASDFIMDTGNVNAFEKTELVLYFADESGRKLVKERREVIHSINTSLEQLIVEELIKGPRSRHSQATLPEDLKILSLTVTDNTCFINLDSAFLNTLLPVGEQIPIYSIVNSLCGMTAVTKVQIMVNGNQNVLLRDMVSLNTVFEMNDELILSE